LLLPTMIWVAKVKPIISARRPSYCTVECKNIFFTAGAGAHAKPASHLASNNNNNEAQSFKFILMSSETRINKENREG